MQQTLLCTTHIADILNTLSETTKKETSLCLKSGRGAVYLTICIKTRRWQISAASFTMWCRGGETTARIVRDIIAAACNQLHIDNDKIQIHEVPTSDEARCEGSETLPELEYGACGTCAACVQSAQACCVTPVERTV